MANNFEIDIPMKDHPMAVMVQRRDETDNAHVFDLYYCNEFCGCMFQNQNGVWIYEPHAHAALLFDAEQIQHLGKEIGEHSYNS
ncbi:hypothetical protein ACFQ3S_01510 [Mucilaginibacter terrae]|uniref:hypothetical protein n=1 Tax=Mucilaginibacter terrae TaxID=1955052 RepID=UPI003643E806